jgi:hypothetical protein
MIHCFNLLENFRTYAILNLGGLSNAHGIGLSGLAAGGVEYVWENASLWKAINVIKVLDPNLGLKTTPRLGPLSTITHPSYNINYFCTLNHKHEKLNIILFKCASSHLLPC